MACAGKYDVRYLDRPSHLYILVRVTRGFRLRWTIALSLLRLAAFIAPIEATVSVDSAGEGIGGGV